MKKLLDNIIRFIRKQVRKTLYVLKALSLGIQARIAQAKGQPIKALILGFRAKIASTRVR